MAGRTWESLTERLIREAQDRGEFDGLPHHGEPLPVRHNPYAGEMALAFDMLQGAGIAPPWIEADKEARTWLERRDRLFERAAGTGPLMHRTLERELAEVVARYNDAVDRVNAGAPTPRQHRVRLVPREELEALRLAFGTARQ